MSAIGPGDWVECVASESGRITVGAIYQVSFFGPCCECDSCGDVGPGVALHGVTPTVIVGDDHYWLCTCGLKPWPGPADEALRSEPADHDVREPA